MATNMNLAIAGISGTGKGSIITALSNRYPEVNRISSTVILLKYFGIMDLDYDDAPTPDMYKKLEAIPQSEKMAAYESEKFAQLFDHACKPGINIFEVHLVIPVRKVNNEVEYISQQPTSWYKTAFDGFIYLTAKPEIIAKRKGLDLRLGVRDRGESTIGVESTIIQQKISDEVWGTYSKVLNPESFLQVDNSGVLEDTTDIISDFIDNLEK